MGNELSIIVCDQPLATNDDNTYTMNKYFGANIKFNHQQESLNSAFLEKKSDITLVHFLVYKYTGSVLNREETF